MHFCQPCLHTLPWWNTIPTVDDLQIYAAFEYAPPISHWIHALKFHHTIYYARHLANLWCHRWQPTLQNQLPDCIIPLPLHTHRLRSRGFNQTLLIASQLKKRLHIPLKTTLLKKIRETPAQSTLTAFERQHNVDNVFTARVPVPEHIALLDDVVTTGATATAARQALMAAGAKTVDVWCIAYTAFERHKIIVHPI